MCSLTEENFNTAAERVKTLKITPPESDQLKLYGLYKTVTIGKVNISKPGILDLKGRKKYESWKKYEIYSKEEAMITYAKLAAVLILHDNS